MQEVALVNFACLKYDTTTTMLALLVFLLLISSALCFHPKPDLSRPVVTRLQMSMDDEFFKIWRATKTVLPPVITGAYSDGIGDHDPGGALYNMIFVRGVTIACTGLYLKNLIHYDANIHPLPFEISQYQFSLDFGLGDPVDIPPLLVALVVGRILAPAGTYPF